MRTTMSPAGGSRLGGAGETRGHTDSSAVTAHGVTFGHVVTSEWIRLRALLSTTYLLVAVLLSLVGFAIFAAVGTVVADGTDPAGAAVDPLGGALLGVSPAELLVCALGVLTVSGEYASGAIRSTFTAVPRRPLVVFAKAAVAAGVVLVVALAGTLLAFVLATAVLATDGTSLSLAAPGVLRALVGAALYLAVVAVLGVAFGWLVRSTAGALAALFGLLYVLPVIGLLLPGDLRDHVVPYLPNNAGIAVMQLTEAGLLQPWAGLGLFTAYAATLLLVAAWLTRRRDA